jgi:membrane-associated tyrosine/threonine-specific cdc2-inhibitory kinase
MQSSKKQRKPVPKTPVKKSKSVFGTNGKEIHSPISNTLKFEEDPSTSKMVVKMMQGANNKFNSEFEVIKKLGEGCFGEAFMVRSRNDGMIYAIKKSKQKYIGIRDRESKLQEVFKALKITNPTSLTY